MCERAAVVCQRGGCVWRTSLKNYVQANVCVCVSGEIMNISVWVRLYVCVCVCVYAGSLLGKHMYVPNYVSVSVVVCFA